MLSSCKKDNQKTSIILYNKPLSTIKQYVQGNWKIVYEYGGLCGNCKFTYNSYFIDITSNNKFVSNSFLYTYDTTTIYWVKALDIYTLDSTYLMTFRDIHDVPWKFVIQQIYNDTLIFYDSGYDALYYHCVRYK